MVIRRREFLQKREIGRGLPLHVPAPVALMLFQQNVTDAAHARIITTFTTNHAGMRAWEVALLIISMVPICLYRPSMLQKAASLSSLLAAPPEALRLAPDVPASDVACQGIVTFCSYARLSRAQRHEIVRNERVMASYSQDHTWRLIQAHIRCFKSTCIGPRVAGKWEEGNDQSEVRRELLRAQALLFAQTIRSRFTHAINFDLFQLVDRRSVTCPGVIV